MNYDVAIPLIKRFEGCRLKAYKDSVGVWTIGWGTTHGVYPGMECTQLEADAWLFGGIQERAEQIQPLLKVQITDNMFCALLSFTYNVGITAFYHSTLLVKLNSGLAKVEVANELLKWDHAGGKVEPGLTRRRLEERTLFLT